MLDPDDLRALGKAFTTRDPDGNGKADTYGFVVPASTKRGYTSWYFSSFLWSGGGDYLTENGGKYKPAINSEGTISALTRVQRWWKDKLIPPDSPSWDDSKNNASYQDLGPDHFDRADREKTASRLVRKLGELGYAVEVKVAA